MCGTAKGKKKKANGKLKAHTARISTPRLSFCFLLFAFCSPPSRNPVSRIEVAAKGLNLRYIVTNMKQAKAQVLYQQIYCARGQMELYIKEHKLYLPSSFPLKATLTRSFQIFELLVKT